MLKWRKLRPWLILILGGAIQAFGLYHVHSVSGVAEGGILGITLLLEHWVSWSPAWTGLFLNAVCYGFGWRILGRRFIYRSIAAGIGFSGGYAVFECFPRLWPGLTDLPLLAAVVGALFVGIGTGLCVGNGGAPGGDDALAMSLHKLTGIRLQWLYLISDGAVLALSVSYIPLKRLIYSLLTVLLSGKLVDLVSNIIQKTDLPD